jgi:catechol 2,3-dioxygenase-like lactoylglutathione lyase family enzyme
VTSRPRVTGMTPLLIVSDLQQSLAFYRRLGFGEENAWGEPPGFAMLHRDGFELMLSLVEGDAMPRPNGSSGVWDVYLRVTDLATEQQALADAGIPIDSGPRDAFYDMREIEILDPDGYAGALPRTSATCPRYGKRHSTRGDHSCGSSSESSTRRRIAGNARQHRI